VGCHVIFFFVRWRKKREAGDDGNGCWVLAAWELGWRKTSVFVIAKHQFLRQGSATRKGRLSFHFDLVCSSDLRSDQSSSYLGVRCSSFLVVRMRKEWCLFWTVMVVNRFDRRLSCLTVFTPIEGCCFALRDSLLVASNMREYGGYSSGGRRWSTPSGALTSSSE